MRWLFRLLGLVLVLVIVLIVGVLMIPTDRIAAIAAQRFEAATGRQLTISGGLKPSFWPELGVTAGKVEIANASWSKAGPMVTAGGFKVGVDPLALLSGEVKVNRIELDKPQIVLEVGKDGRANWELAAPAAGGGAAAPASGSAPAQGGGTGSGGPGISGLTIDTAVIRGGSVTYLDDATGSRRTLDAIDATFHMPKAGGAADLKLTGTLNGQALGLSAALAKPDDVLAGRPAAVKADLSAGGSKIAFDGTADPGAGRVKGALDASVTDLPALFRLAGQAAPALPQGLGAKRILAKGTLDADASGQVSLDQADLTLDGNQLKGKLSAALSGARPRFAAILSAGQLDLSALGGGRAPAAAAQGPAGGQGQGAPVNAGWSKTPIDVSPLKLVDADVTLGASGLDLGTLKLGRTDVTLRLKNGTALVGLKQVVAYKGTISGQITADASRGLSVTADLTAAHVALQPLLTDFADYKRLSGSGTVTAKLASAGTTMDALMRGLSGAGAIDFGKGELQGFDLAGMLTHLNANYEGPGAKTIFDSIKASYAIKGGVLSNSDLAFASPILSATGAGTVDIGNRTLAYTVTPVAFRGLNGGDGVQVPLKISGPWAKPRFGLDMSSKLGQKIKTEREKLKDKVEQKAKAQAEKALGMQPGSSNGSLKDIAKQGILNLLQKK